MSRIVVAIEFCYLKSLYLSTTFFCKIAFASTVARWYILKPKIPIWVNFGRLLQWNMLVFLWVFCQFNRQMVYYFIAIWYIFGHLVYYVIAIWYIFWSFGIIFPVLVCCIEKCLATLFASRVQIVHNLICHRIHIYFGAQHFYRLLCA
jgi:hypothetical protein